MKNTYITSYSKEYETCKKCYIFFNIFFNKEIPSIESFKDLQRSNDKFFLSSENMVDSKDLRDHINWVAKKVRKYKKDILDLKNKNAINIEIKCYWYSQYGDGGPAIWKRELENINDLMGDTISFHFSYEDTRILMTKDIKVGYRVKNRFFEIGFPSDMMLFFDCIKFFVEDKYKDKDWSVITDRFYKRYLRDEDVEEALAQMKKIEIEFKSLPVDALDCDALEIDKRETDLNFKSANSLYEVFEECFIKFYEGIDDAVFGTTKDSFEYYDPFRVCIYTIPLNFDYGEIPLSKFDALSKDDSPKWYVADTRKMK